MGTEYVLLERDGEELVSLLEASNKFDLYIETELLVEITTEELVSMALKMLATATYWTTDDEFVEYMKKHIDYYLKSFLVDRRLT